MECPFVFSSSAEIPAFCPGDQCLCTCFPLRLSPLRGPPAETSIAWCFSRHSRRVTLLTFVFPKNTWQHSFIFFSSPLRLSLAMNISSSCFISIYFFPSFTISQVDLEMLVQVKHRGCVLYQVFITKGEGEGSTYRGRAGEICKKEGRRIN